MFEFVKNGCYHDLLDHSLGNFSRQVPDSQPLDEDMPSFVQVENLVYLLPVAYSENVSLAGR